MPTLDTTIEYPNFTLKCHSTRKPDEKLVQKLEEALLLARKMVNDAKVQLDNVIGDSWENKFQPNPHPVGARAYESKYPVAVEAAKYHLKLTEWTPIDRLHVSRVMEETSRGLNAPIILSDMWGLYTNDLYKVYRDKLDIKDARSVQSGGRAATDFGKGMVDLNYAEGYVKSKDGVSKSIHIEFSLATIYPRAQMARVIVHEATHKFAGTIDEAYCFEGHYRQIDKPQRIRNADSYTYVVLSIYANQLIKDMTESCRVIPQIGPAEWEHAADQALDDDEWADILAPW
jgi:hypothetical protein